MGKEGDLSSVSVPYLRLFSFADSLDVALMIIGTLSAVVSGLSFPLMTILFGQLITLLVALIKAMWSMLLPRLLFDMYTSVLDLPWFHFYVGKFIYLASAFFGGFAIAFIKGWLQTLVTLASIPLLAAAFGSMPLLGAKYAKHAQLAYANAGNTAQQTVGSIRTVVSFTGESEAIAKYKMALTASYLASIKQDTITGLGVGIIFLILFCTFGMSLWYGSILIIEKGYTGGQVMVVTNVIVNGGMSLGNASSCIRAFATANEVALKVFETIGRKLEIDAEDTRGIILEDLKGEVESNGVDFSYPTRPDVVVFSGFSLHVPSGTTLALVGESGSGKSTVVSLIQRFYDPQGGEVLIDAVNLKKLQLGWIRRRIGLVSQEPVLFATTIKENIAYGKVGATLEEIQKAADLANASTFINKMPQGLDTLVGEHGTLLSGGQKQRIAIARAIVKNPQILLLDEATSALDAESERMTQATLLHMMVGTTTIVIAHRLSTIKGSDCIAVVHQGKIVEKGSHSELTNNPGGTYSKLIRLQEINVVESVEAVSDDVSLQAHSLPGTTCGVLNDDSDDIFHNGVAEGVKEEATCGDASSSEKPTLKTVEAPTLLRLASLNKPEIPILMLGCTSAALSGVLFPTLGLLLANLIHTFYEPRDKLRMDANFWSLMCVLLGVCFFVVTTTQFYLFGVAGARLIRRIRAMSFKSVVYQEIGWFEDAANSSGAIGARLSANAATLRRLSGDLLDLLVHNVVTVTVGVAIAFSSNWRLALIVLGLLPFIAIQDIAQFKFMKR